MISYHVYWYSRSSLGPLYHRVQDFEQHQRIFFAFRSPSTGSSKRSTSDQIALWPLPGTANESWSFRNIMVSYKNLLVLAMPPEIDSYFAAGGSVVGFRPEGSDFVARRQSRGQGGRWLCERHRPRHGNQGGYGPRRICRFAQPTKAFDRRRTQQHGSTTAREHPARRLRPRYAIDDAKSSHWTNQLGVWKVWIPLQGHRSLGARLCMIRKNKQK